MDPNFPSQLQFSSDTVILKEMLNTLRRRVAQCGLCTIAKAKRMTSTVFYTYIIQSKEQIIFRLSHRKPRSPQSHRNPRRRRVYHIRVCLRLSEKERLDRNGLLPKQLAERCSPDPYHVQHPQQHVPKRTRFSASRTEIFHQTLHRHLDASITVYRNKEASELRSKVI